MELNCILHAHKKHKKKTVEHIPQMVWQN